MEVKGTQITDGKQGQVFLCTIGQHNYYIKHYFGLKGVGCWLGYSRNEVELRNLLWFKQQGFGVCTVAAHGLEKKSGATK